MSTAQTNSGTENKVNQLSREVARLDEQSTNLSAAILLKVQEAKELEARLNQIIGRRAVYAEALQEARKTQPIETVGKAAPQLEILAAEDPSL